MRSLDTNVLLRVILGDDTAQEAIARRIICEPALVTVTVVIETYWVLARRIGFTATQIALGFDVFFELPTLHFVHREAIVWAIDKAKKGADFADMLHLALSGAADSFATFDRDIAKYGKDGAVLVEILG